MTSLESVRDELTLSPERTRTILRITALCVVVVVVSMTLRVPEAAISAYMVFFVTKEDSVTTAITGAGLIASATLGIALALVLYSLTLGEPALRVPLMALLVFGGMFFSRVSPAGPVAFALGFICALALTLVDQVPVPELLVRALLWLWVVVAYPTVLVVLANLVLGRKPAELFIEGLARRLEAAARLLAADRLVGSPEARQLEKLRRAGAVELAKYQRFGPPAAAPTRAALLAEIDQLLTLLGALPAPIEELPAARAFLRRVGETCSAAASALRSEEAMPQFALLDAERRQAAALPPAAFAVLLELSDLAQTLQASIVDFHDPRFGRETPPPESSARRLLAFDAFTNPEHVRFALKTTLAAMLAYLVYTGLAWPGIRTAMITCFFVALDSLGETIHKLTLRLVGALAGAALGIFAILVVVPRLDSIAGLVVLVALGTLPAAVIATGSSRISYAGWQIAYAFYVCVLHGFGPSTDMVVARDRVIGILLGNVIITVVFASLWPTKVRPAIARALADAIDCLGRMLRAPALAGGAATPGERVAFRGHLVAARRHVALERFEPAPGAPVRLRRLDERAVERVEALFAPVAVLAQRRPTLEGRERLPAAAQAVLAGLDGEVGHWLADYAEALRQEGPAPAAPPSEAIAALAPALASEVSAPNLAAEIHARLEWHRLLAAQLEHLVAREAAVAALAARKGA